MSKPLQTTPSRHGNLQLNSKTRRQETSSSPYTRRYAGQSMSKVVLTVKRTEEMNEKNDKIRELETKNSLLEERLVQYAHQKQGLERTLMQRVDMYKKIIKEKQEKSQKTLESIQIQFKAQLKQLNRQKEEEQSFFQQQSQILNEKVQFLQNQNYDLQQKVSHSYNLHSDLTSEIEKLKVQNQALKQRYEGMEKEKNLQIQKLDQSLKQMQQQWRAQKNDLKTEFQTLIGKKDAQIKTIQEKLDNEVRALQSLKHSEGSFKDNQIAELKRLLQVERMRFQHTLEAERLKYDHIVETQSLKNVKMLDEEARKAVEALNERQKSIDMLSRDLAEINKNLQQSHIVNSQLKDQVQQIQAYAKSLEQQIQQLEQQFGRQKHNFVSIIQGLKEEIRLNQMNFMREKQRNEAICNQNNKLQSHSADRQVLAAELVQLRSLLMESSTQIQLCRERFLVFERQNKKLLFQIQKTKSQSNGLLRVKRDLEEEVIKWRQNYLRLAH